jgi:hypothetical protein
MIESPKIRNLIKTTIYYFVVAGLFFFSNTFFEGGGPCGPGIGILVILIGAPTTMFLILRNFYLLSKNKKEHVYSFFMHLVMVLLFCILVCYL